MGCSCSKTKEKVPSAAKAAAPSAAKAVKEKPVVREQIQATPTADPRAVRLEQVLAQRGLPFAFNRCTVDGGDVTPCFENGLAYRIVKGHSWYIYNDTLDREIHVDYRFGPGSDITPGPTATAEMMEDGWLRVHAVVYPLETVLYFSGTINGFKSAVTAKPLSEAYRARICKEPNARAAAELATVRRLAGGVTDEEVILRLCVQHRVPYVDVNFPPQRDILSRKEIDGRQLGEVPMMRPNHYLGSDATAKADVVCGAVLPHSVEPGLLGDSWLSSTAAILAAHNQCVQGLFADCTPAEKAVGAYRVNVNKGGWWRSVIVDDYLPTVGGIPVFARSVDDQREMWVSCFQKAYAKLHGSYASITGGDVLHALQDFSGAPTYRLDKEWAAAATDMTRVKALADKLVKYQEEGYAVVVNTPAYNSTSYLGTARAEDREAFNAKYAQVGLRNGYAYQVLESVFVPAKNLLLLHINNPWTTKSKWNGAWSTGSEEWRQHPDAAAACQHASSVHGSFWMAWEDAANYFDGGGVCFHKHGRYDYRVKGAFTKVHPSVALQVTATEPVTVTLMLSQRDKRGLPVDTPGARFAPIMLSVSHQDGELQRVQVNSTSDPQHPSTAYDFAVARNVAFTYTFDPSVSPYLVIPRVHQKGVYAGCSRDFTIGILSDEPLEGKLHVELKRMDEECLAFKNIAAFDARDLADVEAEHQLRLPNGQITVSLSSVLSSAHVPLLEPKKVSLINSEDYNKSNRDSEEVISQHDVVEVPEGVESVALEDIRVVESDQNEL